MITNTSFRDSETRATESSAPPDRESRISNTGFSTVLTGLLVIIAFSVSLSISACTGLSDYDERSINQLMADSLLGMTDSENVRMELIIDGFLKVVAESPRSETHEGESHSQTKLIGPPVHVTVFDTTGTVETTVRSDRAIYRSRTSVFDFEGDVIIENRNNRTLRSEQLQWNETTQRISTPGFVIITTPADSITGYGFNGREDMSQYTLRNVTGQFSIK